MRLLTKFVPIWVKKTTSEKTMFVHLRKIAIFRGYEEKSGAPRAKRDFRFCEGENWRRKCCSLVRKTMWSPKKKKFFTKISTVFPVEIRWSPRKKKKKIFTEILTVFSVEIGLSPKKMSSLLHMLTSQCHFDRPLLELGLPEANGPPKVHGPRGHCTSLPPPSRWPWVRLNKKLKKKSTFSS